MDLSTPIEQIPRIGPQYQKKLKRLGIKKAGDILFHFPHRYEDFSNIVDISKTRINENCCIRGKIMEIKTRRTWGKKMSLTEAIIEDKTGAIKVTWFNRPYLIRALKKGDFVYLAGKVMLGKSGTHLANPVHEKITNYQFKLADLTHLGRLVPIYPETARLSSRWLRYIIRPLLSELKNKIPDTLPEKIRKEYKFLPIQQAILQIHFPDSLDSAKKAQERFSFENLFHLSLWVLKTRMELAQENAFPLPLNLELMQRFVKSLPFKLTAAQKRSSWQILKDIERPYPMNRLLEGDAGSGKTVVAAMAALSTIKAGYQVALMAPTEILVKQHFKTINDLLKGFNLDVGLLTGKEDKFYSKKLRNDYIEISRKKLLEKTKKGEIDILIGTHALIQDKVKFANLALVILDEQHRFGVEQRARLAIQKDETRRKIPHLLSMTATPIPRTLALTIYGDLDLSLINELPKGRKKIKTSVIPPAYRKKAYGFIRKEVKKGRQVFVICPRIEAGDKEKAISSGDISGWTDVKAVKEEYEKLSKDIFPDLKVGILHGKLAGKEKERVMRDFKNKKVDILVSTSVVEVGVDIPNATIMMIEGAERFGLSQLHQFRGRVGRSRYQSYCFLFTDSPTQATNLRLKALITCENGFDLAEKDLAIRGPGDFSGKRQWGIPDLAMEALKNVFLIEKVKKAAKEIFEEDPTLKRHPYLQEKISEFRERVHLE